MTTGPRKETIDFCTRVVLEGSYPHVYYYNGGGLFGTENCEETSKVVGVSVGV